MQLTTVESVIARLSAAAEATSGGVVAFDGDGTLWSGDVGDDFLYAFAARGDVREPALAALHAVGTAAGVALPREPLALMKALLEAYEAHALSEARFYEVTAWLCAGWREREVTAFIDEVLTAKPVAPRLQRETVRVLEWARSQGLEIRIVSASPLPVVVHAAQAVGLRPEEVVAVEPVYEAGVMRAAVKPPTPYARGKVEALRLRIGQAPLLGAFGDNLFDLELLQAAQVPVAVRPKPRLRAKSGDVAGLVELSRE